MMAKCDHRGQRQPDCPWCTDELFHFRGVWHVRHDDGTEEDIILNHGDLVQDAKGSAGQFLLERVREAPARGGPKQGDLKFLQGKTFAYLQLWSHTDPAWYELSGEGLVDDAVRQAQEHWKQERVGTWSASGPGPTSMMTGSPKARPRTSG